SRDVRQVAEIIMIVAGDEPEFADALLDAAAHAVEPAARIVLAALLRDHLPPVTEASVWAVCSRDLDEDTLLPAFDALAQHAGASGVRAALREAAMALPVGLVAKLARNAHRWVGENAVTDTFRPLVRGRSLGDIGELADRLLDN